MDKYTPPFNINNEMLWLTASISEKVTKIDITQNLNVKPHLRRSNKIRSIHSSLKIEANPLTLGQVRDVINGQQVLGRQREIQEVKNAYEAYEHISEIDPYSIKQLKELHGIMTKYLTEGAGEFRKGEEGVFDGNRCIFMAPLPHLVPELMKGLFGWMKREKDSVHPLIMSAVFHYEFVFIHPFSDGNGRVARLWHTALLSKWKPVFEYIPIESRIEKFQDEYYSAIAKCHANGNSDVFIEFMLRQTDKILEETSAQLDSDFETVSEYVRKMLSVMEYDVSYSAAEIMEKIGVKSKETFRKNYINPAIKLGLVSMTVPDKPQSRNQRYIKK